MRDKNIFFDYGVVEEAKKRAKTLGANYDAILARNELSAKILASARGAYGRAAASKGYKKDVNIGIMDEQKYIDFCTSFMIEPKAYLYKEPPMEEKAEEKDEKKPERIAAMENEDLLLCLEELSKAIRANTVQVINLREQNYKDHREAVAKIPDERIAVATEEAASALKTTNRALDAIDNKLNVLISSMQRVESKMDRGNNATIDAANKLKSIVEATSGILNKVVKICALYDKPRAR